MSTITDLPIADLKAMLEFAEKQVVEHIDNHHKEGIEYWDNVANICRIQLHFRALKLFGKP